ncbi:MAG: hypothetical protein JWP01_1407 [Myxococcales bacterium]|nr:hypothetical protein [Myxococcales bacterium]
MAALAEMKMQWREFKHDRPGERFCNQRRRMKNGSKALMVAQVALGVLLVSGGVLLLFIPGPGLLFIVFGLALIAGLSNKLAALMDRMEPKVRRGARALKRWWSELHVVGKIGLGLVAATGAAAFFYAMYRLWFI